MKDKIVSRLFALRDEKYAQTQMKMLPTVWAETIIGVRTPALRSLARESYRVSEEHKAYLKTLRR